MIKLFKKKQVALFLSSILIIGGLPAGLAPNVVSAAEPQEALITTSSEITSYNYIENTTKPLKVVIDPAITVYDSTYTQDLKAATVVIENLQDGDQLDFEEAGVIKGAYNSDNGILTLTGTTSFEGYTEALSNVKFSTISNVTSDRIIKFTLGDALPYEANGHFYKYVDKGKGNSITWDNARSEAEAKNSEYFGRKGYLVTITSLKENTFVQEKTLGIGWIGAKDIERDANTPKKTGDWRWVTGPEGLDNGGQGTQFYQGYTGSGKDLLYTNWDSGEPNDYGGTEFVAHIFGPDDRPGKWNDYSPTNPSVVGYIVEYGGMPGDNDVQISAEKTLSFVNVTELTKAKAVADQLKEEDYAETEWREFEKALEAANTVIENRSKTQGEVDTALEALKDAQEQLKPRVTITEPSGDTVYVSKPEFKGAAVKGATVTAAVYDKDGTLIGTPQVQMNPDGTWSFAPDQELPDGDYVVEVTAEKDGKTSTEKKNVTVDTTKPNVQITEPSGEKVNVAKPEFKGIADKDAKVIVELKDESGKVVERREVEVDSNGNWSFTPSADLTDGKYTVNVTAEKHGKVSTDTKNVTVDATDESQLSGLELKRGDGTPIAISPAFNGGVTDYQASVTQDVYNTTVTLATYDPNATIEISLNGGAWQGIPNGSASDELPLAFGTNTIVVKVTDSQGNVTEYTLTITRGSNDNNNNNNNGGNSGGSTTPSTPPSTPPATTPPPADPGVNTSVNGNNGGFATGKTTISEGNKQTSVLVNRDKLGDILSNGTGQKLSIQSPNDGNMQVDGLTAADIRLLADKGASLDIGNPLAIYPVPSKQLNLNSVSGQLGNAALNDIAVHIDIKRSSETLRNNAKNKATSAGYQLLVDPVDLDMTFSQNGKTVRSGQLNGYAPKYIALPEGIDPNRITTGVVVNPDGSVYHLPTVVTKIGDRYYAQIHDLRSSGSYSVIWNPQDFDDVRTHWAQTEVNNISARLDLKGNGGNIFAPNRNVTRAEFAEIVVLGLGLMRQEEPKTTFDDVSATAWYHNAISIGSEFGIVLGYNDGAFRGNQTITREEGMAMIARGYQLIKPGHAISETEISRLLAGYEDASQVARWAKPSVATLLSADIVQGSGDKGLTPKSSMTRAETVALMQRLLQVTNLID
ncbi:S-layer homology domain-containing protein [Paenibacillus sp. ISL-20]|uniref:S-layer homology domain-containing protein n=1 Tax=Paenibacillus sp. ISL-20 TaxID=2819163 RepID=UPI001BE70C74|nr:S-layer homology domain-containing protein [Paenibacillus sp. ISL-20]MBT2765865.1 S-layer homology domain-containing protein [Paenibacillus sp. ISL-20]